MSLEGVRTYQQWTDYWRKLEMEKRNDAKGYERGAKGIDGREGEGFDYKGAEKGAWEKQFGRNWAKDGSREGDEE